jgi:hypothetical protein
MQKKRIRSLFRETVDDIVESYGWSDITVDTYLDEAMDVFCEDTGFFVDFNAYTITTVAGQPDYDFDPDLRVMQILEVWNPTTGVRLSQFGEDDRPDYIDTWSPIVPFTTPYMWQTDRTTGVITFYPAPALAGEVFQMRVWRYARTSFALMAETAEPEIPKTCQMAIIEYAAYKAYMHHDRERANLPAASNHLKAYRDYVYRGKRLFEHTRGTPAHVAPSVLYAFR